MADLSLRHVAGALGIGGSFSVCADVLGFTGGKVPARLRPNRAQPTVSMRGYVESLRGSNFDVTLILAGSDIMTTADAAVVDYAVYRAREIYAGAGFCLRLVRRDPRTVANSLGHDNITSSAELSDTNKDLTVDGDTLPVVLPANMSVTEKDPNGNVTTTLGRSPIGGPCGHRDTSSNSSVVMINGEETARTLAHEMGHFMGCQHPSTPGTNLMAQTGAIQATGADPFDAVTIIAELFRPVPGFVVAGYLGVPTPDRARLLAAERDQLVGRGPRARPEADVGPHGFATVLVRHADDRGPAHGRVAEQRVLHLPRPHLVPGGDDRVLLSVHQVGPAIGIHEAHVAGAQFPARQGLLGGLGPVPVAGHHHGAAGGDLADLAGREVVAVVVDDPDDNRSTMLGAIGAPPLYALVSEGRSHSLIVGSLAIAVNAVIAITVNVQRWRSPCSRPPAACPCSLTWPAAGR